MNRRTTNFKLSMTKTNRIDKQKTEPGHFMKLSSGNTTDKNY